MRPVSYLFLYVFLVIGYTAGAQSDSSGQMGPIPKASRQPLSDVQKATLLSLIPGGGQIYNGKYWKVPVIYAGFAALTYSFIFYEQVYSESREAYKQKVNGEPVTNPEYANVPEEMLYSVRESYRKSRDLSVIGLAGLYAFNLLDAAVDAHLKGFDVGENLSMRIVPGFQPATGGMVAVVRVGLRLK